MSYTPDSVAPGDGHAIQDEGAALATRPYLNFAGGGVTAIDDAGNNRTTVTVPAGLDIGIADTRYLYRTTDTMSGVLTSPGIQFVGDMGIYDDNSDVAIYFYQSRAYVVDKGWGGHPRNLWCADPVDPNDATTRRYVDQIPWGYCTWGSTTLAGGTGRIVLAPSGGAQLVYGMNWDLANRGFRVPVGGYYTIGLNIGFNGISASQYGPCCGIGTTGTCYGWGSTDHSSTANSFCRSSASFTLGFYGDEIICPWYSVLSGIGMADGTMSVQYEGVLG